MRVDDAGVSLNPGLAVPGSAPSRLWKWLEEKMDFSRYAPRPQEGIVSRKFEGKRGSYHILKSPTGQYMKMEPTSFFLWSNMDGSKTIADIAVAYFFEFGAFAFARLRTLVFSLRQKGFLDDPPFYLYVWLQQLLRSSGIASWGNSIARSFLQREFAIRGLDGILTRLYRGGIRLLFLKPMVRLYWLIVAAGAVIFTQLVIQGRYSLLKSNNSVGLGILWLYAGLVITIVLHEGAHAFTVKHYGCEVRRGGVMLYLGMPGCFVDTQDIWLADKKARIAVSWAGPFMNLILGGILAGVIFFFPTLALSDVLFKLAAVTYLNGVLNLNPLIEMDGYFILMDWLEMPSLRQRSLSFLREKLFAKLRALERFSSEERIFLVFGLLAAVYTVYFLSMSLFIIQRWVLQAVVNLWNRPSIWGKLLIAVVVVVGALPLAYSLLRRVYLAVVRAVAWLAARGVFASSRNIAILLLVPAVLCHAIPWLAGRALQIVEFCRPVFLLLGLGAILLVLRSYDRSYRDRATLALGLPILAFLGSECVSLVAYATRTTLPATSIMILRAAGTATWAGVAYLSFDPDNLRLASRLERNLMAILLVASASAGPLISFRLAEWSVPLLPSVLMGAAAGIALTCLALMVPLLGSFWHSQLRYPWLYVTLALSTMGTVAVWEAFSALQGSMRWASSLALTLGYSFAAGGVVLYYLTKTRPQALDRLEVPAEGLRTQDQLTQAAKHLLEAMLAQYQGMFGIRRLHALQDAINAASVAAHWGLAVDRGHLTIPDHLRNAEITGLALTYQQLLDHTITLLEQGAGQRFAQQTLQRAYDVLPWESRELVNEYILQGTAWGSWLSYQFEAMQQDYAALLNRVPVLFRCTPHERDAICARLKERHYAAGETIIRQGDVGDEFYIIKSGKVTVWQRDDKGWDRLVNEHSRGGTFGELALLRDEPRNATCIAATPTTLLALGRQDFLLVRHHLEISQKLDQTIRDIQTLREIPLFAETPAEELNQIAMHLVPETFAPGHVFVRQGEAGDKFYIIREGAVEVFTSDEQGREEIIARRGRSEYVGEIALLLDIPRTASIRAVVPTTLLSLTRGEFLDLIARDAQVQQSLERVRSRRMRNLQKRRLEEKVLSPAI